MDAKVFDAYDRCDLTTFAAAFDPRVAFYHDTGGATFDRDTVVANTRKYICGKVRRELIASTFHVYPIKIMARSRMASIASVSWRRPAARASPSS